jgi:hypothetical protein
MKKENIPDTEKGGMTASEMGRKRWAGVSAEERKEALAKAREHINLSAEERSEIARNAVNARWERVRAEKQAADKPARTKKRIQRKAGPGIP